MNVTELVEPIKIAKNVLTHVGQATNKPVNAPMPVSYTHLPLPTKRIGHISVSAASLKRTS